MYKIGNHQRCLFSNLLVSCHASYNMQVQSSMLIHLIMKNQFANFEVLLTSDRLDPDLSVV